MASSFSDQRCRACLRRTAKRLKSWTGLRRDPEMIAILNDIRRTMQPRKK